MGTLESANGRLSSRKTGPPQEPDYRVNKDELGANSHKKKPGGSKPPLREAEYYKYYSSGNPGNLPPIVITSNEILCNANPIFQLLFFREPWQPSAHCLHLE
jgi:hypothetical protein